MGCTPTPIGAARLDTAVAAAFTAAKGLHGSPRLIADLRDLGWEVSEKTVADSMRRQGLVARRIKRRNGLTKQEDGTEVPGSGETGFLRGGAEPQVGR